MCRFEKVVNHLRENEARHAESGKEVDATQSPLFLDRVIEVAPKGLDIAVATDIIHQNVDIKACMKRLKGRNMIGIIKMRTKRRNRIKIGEIESTGTDKIGRTNK